MFDGAEVLLGARDDFGQGRHQPGAIGAVFAVETLDEIEIAEVVPVEHDVISTPDLGNAINWKAARLIESDQQVHHGKRDDHRVNDGSGDQVLRALVVSHRKKFSLSFWCAWRIPRSNSMRLPRMVKFTRDSRS